MLNWDGRDGFREYSPETDCRGGTSTPPGLVHWLALA